MKSLYLTRVLAIGELVVVVLVLNPLLASAEQLPTRKPGLWEMRITPTGAPSTTMKHCTDESTDAKMMQMGEKWAGQMGVQCAKNELKKEGSDYVSESDCNFSGSRMLTKSVFRGDFNSRYTATTSSKFEPPMMGLSGSESTINATWIGPCEAGQKPGDVIMPDGTKLNLDGMAAAAEGKLAR